jgi:hypothetical protein
MSRRLRARRFCWTDRGEGYRGGKRWSGYEKSCLNEGKGQQLAYVCMAVKPISLAFASWRWSKADAGTEHMLTKDKARRIARKLPSCPNF